MGDGSRVAFRWFAAALSVAVLIASMTWGFAQQPPVSKSGQDAARRKFQEAYAKWRKLQAEGDYFAAFQQGAAALEASAQAFPPTSLYAARVFSELGELQVLLGNFPEAEVLLNRAFAIRRAQPDKDNLDLAETQLVRGQYFAATRQFQAATEALADAVRIFDLQEAALRGEKDAKKKTAAAARVAVGQLGAALAQAHLQADVFDPAECRKAADKAVALAAAMQPPQAAPAAEARLARGRALNAEAKYREARADTAAACEELEKALKANHPRVLWARYYLTRTLSNAGEDELAEQKLFEILQAVEQQLGDDHLLAAYCHNDLASHADRQGDLAAARRHLNRALEIKEFRLGEDNYEIAVSLAGLARVMLSTGQDEQATRLLERCLAINEETLGKQSPAYARSMVDMALIAGSYGDVEECEEQLVEAHQILSQRLGAKHPSAAVVQYHRARVLAAKKEYDEAEKLIGEVLETYRATLDPLDSRWMAAREVAADLRHKQGHTAEAREQIAALLSDFERGRGADDPNTATVAAILARYAAAAGDWDQVLELSNRQRKLARQRVATVLPTLSAQAQLRYLRSSDRPNLQSALAWAWARAKDSRFTAASAEWLVNGKGVAVEALSRQTLATRDVTDENAVALRRRLSALNRRIAALVLPNMTDADWLKRRAELSELEEQHADLSQMLAEYVPEDAALGRWIALDEVRARIPADAVLVDFSRLRRPENEDEEFSIDEYSEPRYVAWIIPPAGKGDVELVDLGLAERVDEMAEFLRSAVFTSLGEATKEDESQAEERFADATETLARSLLRPLEERLAGINHWILSPDGMLWLVPWGALPYEDGGYCLERHQLTLVTSTRELVRDASETSKEPALVVADPNYNLGLPAEEVEEHPPFALLPQTVEEAKKIIDPVTKITGVDPRLLLGDEAREETVKSIARPSLVMFSTHGFSFGSGYSIDSNPLMWCGLGFAGANGRPTDASAEDGVLTGLEVVGLDLRGTRLVVLSACDTARGEVTSGEGVASLQQAFLLAGAQQVVSTIWPVPVEGTVELVIKFFDALAGGADASTALREAQLHLIKSRREKVKGAHPVHWGAFTITGWNPQ